MITIVYPEDLLYATPDLAEYLSLDIRLIWFTERTGRTGSKPLQEDPGKSSASRLPQTVYLGNTTVIMVMATPAIVTIQNVKVVCFITKQLETNGSVSKQMRQEKTICPNGCISKLRMRLQRPIGRMKNKSNARYRKKRKGLNSIKKKPFAAKELAKYV